MHLTQQPSKKNLKLKTAYKRTTFVKANFPSLANHSETFPRPKKIYKKNSFQQAFATFPSTARLKCQFPASKTTQKFRETFSSETIVFMNWTDNFSQQERKQIDQITRKVSQDLRKDSGKDD